MLKCTVSYLSFQRFPFQYIYSPCFTPKPYPLEDLAGTPYHTILSSEFTGIPRSLRDRRRQQKQLSYLPNRDSLRGPLEREVGQISTESQTDRHRRHRGDDRSRKDRPRDLDTRLRTLVSAGFQPDPVQTLTTYADWASTQ
jgi:hypothetical protein